MNSLDMMNEASKQGSFEEMSAGLQAAIAARHQELFEALCAVALGRNDFAEYARLKNEASAKE